MCDSSRWLRRPRRQCDHHGLRGHRLRSGPTVSPDGTKIAWITWNHPNMPWTFSAAVSRPRSASRAHRSGGRLVDRPGVCVYEPRWTLDGDPIHVTIPSGWANLTAPRASWKEGEDVNAWDLPPAAPVHCTLTLRCSRTRTGSLACTPTTTTTNDYFVCSWTEEQVWHIGTVRIDNGMAESGRPAGAHRQRGSR